ncbi:MAG: T9SS type A sorting domain-containing protein, partial [bacterium]|nr:T9SS type A sorting domain-containing protein [bacterium]
FDPSQIRMSVEGLEGNRISGFGDRETSLSLRGSAATKQSHLDNGNREQETGNSRGVPRTPAGNVRDLLRDSRTTGGAVHRTFLSDGVKDNSRGVWHTPDTTETMRADVGVRPYPAPNTQPPPPIAQSPLPIAELLLPTSLGELRTALPSVYQVSANGSRNEIEATFELTDKNTFGITLPNGYNPDHSLRIDPLIYSTFLGGSSGDDGLAICKTTLGNIVVTGDTQSSDFPITLGAYDTTSVGYDIFITSVNPSGTLLLYSTFLGGDDNDYPSDIASDNLGGVIVCGVTFGGVFPTTLNAFDRTPPGPTSNKCFVTRLNSTGSELIFSTYLGSRQAFQNARAVVGDVNGGAFVTGETSGLYFPVTTNAYARTNNGFEDGFITHLHSSGSGLLYSSYFGGNSEDYPKALALDSLGRLCIAGQTSSTIFPTTPNCLQDSLHGWRDAFFTLFSSDLQSLVFSTYIGGSVGDGIFDVTFDGTSGFFLTGNTTSSDFPTSPNCYDSTYNGGMFDGFVANVSISPQVTFTSTYLGGSGDDGIYHIEVDRIHDAVSFVGTTVSSDFPVSQDAYDTVFHDGDNDGFISKLNYDLTSLLYSTYLGGTGTDVCQSILHEGNDTVIIVGRTTSPDFPVTPAAFDTSSNGGWDCFVAKLILRADTSNVVRELDKLLPSGVLLTTFPNPFNSSTTISYSLPKPGLVELRLFDITGREVATLVNQKQQPGNYRVTFDGKKLSSGTYFVRMQAGKFVKTQKMVLLR